MRRPLVVIKVGGSVLTDKRRIYTPCGSEIRRAAKQIARIAEGLSVVLVYGAGSYGHIPVIEHGLTRGFKNRNQLKGLAATKFRLLEWLAILDRALLDQGVKTMPFLASSFITAREGRIISAELEPMRRWLRLGCVPTLGGDIVPDVERGFSIVSGDQLAAYVAIQLKASRLIFGTDVDGVFDSNPKLNPDAHLLADIAPSQASRLVSKWGGGTGIDVTGGMAGKVRESAVAALKGIPVYFVNLRKDHRLKKAATGLPVLCSRVAALRASE